MNGVTTSPGVSRDATLKLLHLEPAPADSALVATLLVEGGIPAELERVGDLEAFRTALLRGRYSLILATLAGSECFEVVRFARANRPGIPVIVISGTPGEELAVDAMKQGATDYVLRQRLDRLVPSVRRALRYKSDEHCAVPEDAAQLQVALERLSLAQRAGRVGVFDWDLESGDIYWTPELEQIFGFRRPESRQYETWARFVERSDLERIEALFAAWRKSRREEASWEYRFSRGSDGVRWIEARARMVRANDGRPLRMVGTNLDITERKRAEEELRRSEQRLRGMFENAALGIVEVDSEGRLSSINRRLCEMLGYEREELLGRNIEELTHPEDRARSRELNGKLRAGELETFAYEKRYLHRDGGPVWVHVTVSALRDGSGGVRSVGTVEDIRERRRAMEALRASEAKFRSVFEQAAIGIGRVSFSDARWIDVNEAFARMLGYSRVEMLAISWPQMTVPEDLDLDLVPFRRMARGELEHYTVEKRFIHKVGHAIWARQTLSLVRDCENRPDYEIAIVEDISERKRVQDELWQASQRLAENDKRKDEFLGVLSHELRNPLTPIRNSAYLLSRAPGLDARGRKAISVIDRQAALLAHLIDDLLDVTRIARGKIRLQRTRCDLVRLVSQVIDDYRASMVASKLEVDAQLPDAEVWVDADEARIAQAAGNLLQNAAKFTPAGGKVTVSVGTDGDAGFIAVRDTGVGIDTETLGRLFQPFSQADRSLERSRGGLGLGLALTKGFIELHGGAIRAESDGPGKGARFTLSLPLAPQVAQAASRPPPRLTPVSTPTQLRVLIVEDNEDAAESLKDVVELDGHEVAVAFDGPEGVRIAQEFSPDLVICDIGLPELDGYGVARALRQEPRVAGAFLVALTGYGQAEDARRSREAGFDRHLVKPVDLDALDQIMRDCLEARALAAEPASTPPPPAQASAEANAGMSGRIDAVRADGCPRVMLVDDDETLRDTLATILRSEGFEVIEARNGSECLSLIQQGIKPDATLLDYRMPGLNGGEVFEVLKTGGLSEAVVLMTAASAAPDLAKKHGFPHFVSKPFGVEDLLDLVGRIVERSPCVANANSVGGEEET